jgi:hypothetical protein
MDIEQIVKSSQLQADNSIWKMLDQDYLRLQSESESHRKEAIDAYLTGVRLAQEKLQLLDDVKRLQSELADLRESLSDLCLFLSVGSDLTGLSTYQIFARIHLGIALLTRPIEVLIQDKIRLQAELAEAKAVIERAKEQEPVHWRAICPEHPESRSRIASSDSESAMRQYALEKKNFQGWNYTVQPLYALPPITEPVVPEEWRSYVQMVADIGLHATISGNACGCSRCSAIRGARALLAEGKQS